METHPLPPFLPANAFAIMLGSFPPPRARWSMEFYYPNLQNDMWRIFGIVFFNNKNRFLENDLKRFNKTAIEEFLRKKGIALGDTAQEVNRLNNNAADKFLEIEKPIDLGDTLKKIPLCKNIITTGQKAADTIVKITGCAEPTVGGTVDFEFCGRTLKLWRMPSSSRAYPMKIEKKAEVYAQMFKNMNMV